MENLFKDGSKLLRIYTVEKDTVNGLPFYEWLCQKACQMGMSGATVLHGIGGFCASNPVRNPEIRTLQINQPVIVEIIDNEENIKRFVELVDGMVPRGIMTLSEVKIRFYGQPKPKQ